MHLRESLGQLFMVGIPHPHLDNETRKTLTELRAGGVILFRRNYNDPENLRRLCADLHALFPDQPLLIALDYEGGRVHRLTPPFTHFPSAGVVGQARSATLARQIGQAMGQELGSVGIDLDFAPVLDVLTNPTNPVIGDRAFASDPHLVALLGSALARGLRDGGVIPCGKHFPGHGATWMDSHKDLPRDERSKDELLRVDLYPFRRVIAERLDMLMTAHVLYPALDPDMPATLSPAIIDGLLRSQLHFAGVVVTDDLEMGAIVKHFTVERAAVDALRAGADLLLVCHSLERALLARDTCMRALSDGTLSRQRVEQAEQRITVLKRRHQRRPVATAQAIGVLAHQQLVEEILKQSAISDQQSAVS